MPANWSEYEVERAVEAYFSMLRLELTGQRYNKARHRRALKEYLNDRSDGSVELKHQNISAVLIEKGIQYIEGYKPRYNYQRSLLPAAVDGYLKKHPEIRELLKKDSEATPVIPSVEDFLAAMEAPPFRVERKSMSVADSPAFYNPTGMNYLEMEARNHSLGDAGEQFVVNYERARLIRASKGSFADRIEQVSLTVGPSAGFDIRSFEKNGSDRFIPTVRKTSSFRDWI